MVASNIFGPAWYVKSPLFIEVYSRHKYKIPVAFIRRNPAAEMLIWYEAYV